MSRTGEDTTAEGTSEQTDAGETLVSGYNASPGIVSRPVRIIRKLDHLDKVQEGDIIVAEMTTPEMVPAMKRAAGIITDDGGVTSHAAIVSRELGVPAVVGTGDATEVLEDGQHVTLDGKKGKVTAAPAEDTPSDADQGESVDEAAPRQAADPTTATGVKVNVSLPEAAERAAATGADGVGLLRLEHILLAANKTPDRYVDDHGERAYVEEIADGVRTVADAFYPRPVRVRTLDAPTDELAELVGGEDEPHEHNPMLGYRGIRRSLAEPELSRLELRAFKNLYEMGYDNVEIMFPMPNDGEEIMAALELMEDVGIDYDERQWGAMIETPASVRNIEEIVACDIDFAALGTNDLIQFLLAVDRNNGNIADRFDALHPTVLEAIGETIEYCRRHDVETSVVGQAASDPEMVEFLVGKGITDISANIDSVSEVRRQVSRAERRLILKANKKA